MYTAIQIHIEEEIILDFLLKPNWNSNSGKFHF